ncbi:MAG TPA: hypothetical protein VN132_15330 [Bdellovibrio sp.]|nr:hypothetical protein [Bdellovibrio sp.]
MNLLKSLVLASTTIGLSLAAFAGSQQTPPPMPSLTTTVTNSEGESLVADSFSRTLYVFDMDQNQTTPMCTGDCAEIWPPYIVTADEAQGLMDPLGTITRTSGKMQLTYKGRPVYVYSLDREVGDDKGDGIGNVWHYIEAGD